MDSQRQKINEQRRISRWPAIALCLCVVAASSSGAYKFQASPTAQQVTKATDEVYEAVIRDMLPKQSEQYRGLQLVFDDRLIVGEFPGGDIESCQAESTKWVQVADGPPPFDTTSDRIYRLLTSGVYRATPGPEVVENYLRARCRGGHLSRTFHTDVPKHFVGNSDFRLRDPLGSISDDSEFAHRFPGASGIIGLSHVGFDSQISDAIVSTSYACGGLCGGGSRYFLKKIGGAWRVVSKRETWVS